MIYFFACWPDAMHWMPVWIGGQLRDILGAGGGGWVWL